jgi:PhnB protein
VGSSLRDIEIDFVVKDSLAALKCYERIFDVERIEVTDLKTGENEVFFQSMGQNSIC